MSNIEKYIPKSPSVLNLKLSRYFSAEQLEGFDAVELIISISETELNIKELSSYLDIIYRVDGHLSNIGYLKYVHNTKSQIEIDRIRFGSWEIVFEKLLNTLDGDKLLIIYLFLKFLPKIVQAVLDSAYRYYEVLKLREDFLEKKEKRASRKLIRQLINNEEKLSFLEKKQREKLVNLLDELYSKTKNRSVPASRFAQKFVKSLKIKPIKKKTNQ